MLACLHARGADLSDNDVAVSVDHHARQSVGLAVSQPVPGRRVEALTERERYLQPMHEERLAGRVPGVAAQDAGADERMRVDVGIAQEAVAIAHDTAERPACEARERRALGIHLVAEDPEVTRGDPAVLAVLQSQFGERGALRRRSDGVRHRSGAHPL